jgi:hypothetical protein
MLYFAYIDEFGEFEWAEEAAFAPRIERLAICKHLTLPPVLPPASEIVEPNELDHQ